MSFRDIGAIINKWKGETEREKCKLEGVYDYNVKSNSKITQAIQLFSEGKAPVDVVIALDIPADEVRAIYREYWELKGMHKLNVIYEEAKNTLPSVLKLHKLVKEQGMAENEVINVLRLANNNELSYLQDKVDYLRNEINNLELEKAECTNHVLTLSKRIDELREVVNAYESSLSEKREETALLNKKLKRLDNLVTNNNGNKNDNDVEIFYASGSWRNVIPQLTKDMIAKTITY
ncbi:MAG: hypothetical protein WBE34_16440 [Candidatus Nitrosopolaris sp.]